MLIQVWLEPVPAAHIIDAKFIPNVDSSLVSVLVTGSPSATNLPLQVYPQIKVPFQCALDDAATFFFRLLAESEYRVR